MKRKLIISLVGVMLAAASGMAVARDHVRFSLFIGAPGYAYVAPPPVYYVPPPRVYYAPPPQVYYAPPPVVYYEPAPWGLRVHRGHHKGWHKRRWD